MRHIYVAGRYRSKFKIQWLNTSIFKWLGIAINIFRAWKAGKKIWANGEIAIVPHCNTAFYDNIAEDQVFIDGTLSILDRCDAIVMLKGWMASSGSKGELDFAGKKKIPIYFGIDNYLKNNPYSFNSSGE